jgi:hypothetical protein
MKLLTVLSALVLSTSAWAQNTMIMDKPDAAASTLLDSKGFSLRAFNASNDIKVTASTPDQTKPVSSASNTFDVDFSRGLSLGHQNVKDRGLGYKSLFSIYEIRINGSSVNLLKGAADLTYGLNKNFFTFAGLNASKFRSNDSDLNNLDPNVGYQFGLGLKLTSRLGFDFGYHRMASSGIIAKNNIEIETSGVELGINTTF